MIDLKMQIPRTYVGLLLHLNFITLRASCGAVY